MSSSWSNHCWPWGRQFGLRPSMRQGVGGGRKSSRRGRLRPPQGQAPSGAAPLGGAPSTHWSRLPGLKQPSSHFGHRGPQASATGGHTGGGVRRTSRSDSSERWLARSNSRSFYERARPQELGAPAARRSPETLTMFAAAPPAAFLLDRWHPLDNPAAEGVSQRRGRTVALAQAEGTGPQGRRWRQVGLQRPLGRARSRPQPSRGRRRHPPLTGTGSWPQGEFSLVGSKRFVGRAFAGGIKGGGRPAIQLQAGRLQAGRLLQAVGTTTSNRRAASRCQGGCDQGRPAAGAAQPAGDPAALLALQPLPRSGAPARRLAHQGGEGHQGWAGEGFDPASLRGQPPLVPKRGSMVAQPSHRLLARSRSAITPSKKAQPPETGLRVCSWWWRRFSGAGWPGRCLPRPGPPALRALQALPLRSVKVDRQGAGAPAGRRGARSPQCLTWLEQLTAG